MPTNAQRLITCTISHSYFSGGNWPDLKVRLCPESKKRLQQERIKLKPMPDGFEIVFLSQGNPVSDALIPVRLLLFPMQAAFEVFTAIPFRSRGSALYFSDLNPSLHPQSPLPQATLVPEVLPFRSNSFVWRQELPDKTNLQVKDDCGCEVGPPLQLSKNRVFIDLTFVPHSRFALCTELEDPKWIVTGEAWGSPPMAILDLHLNLEQAQAELLPRTITLKFKARAVYWRYLLQIPHTPLRAERLKLVEAQGRIQFVEEELPGGEKISGNLELRSFRSTAPIPFQERFLYEISILQVDTEKVLSKKIPFPEATHLEQEKWEDGTKRFIAQKWLLLH